MKNHYNTIAKAIEYIQTHAKSQPSLNDIARHVHLSDSHLQRVFSEFAGVSPKQFLQFINIQSAKTILERNKNHNQSSIFEITEDIGLSSSSRLHDLFVSIESMTPGQYKSMAESINIEYEFIDTLFGQLLIASTPIGICYIGFNDKSNFDTSDLTRRFKNATFINKPNNAHKNAISILNLDTQKSKTPFDIQNLKKIKLHLKGSDFQLQVWQALLKIPQGSLSTYGEIAKSINNQNASRAVGTAIGANPISILIPCHRVIQQTGLIGGYMWGPTRKTTLIGWELAHSHINKQDI